MKPSLKRENSETQISEKVSGQVAWDDIGKVQAEDSDTKKIALSKRTPQELRDHIAADPKIGVIKRLQETVGDRGGTHVRTIIDLREDA